MQGAVLYAPGDVRIEERPDPVIETPTDAVIRLAATCVCGSDLWPYRGIEAVGGPSPMGHEYVGVVEQVGTEVRTIKPGQFVVGSFFASDNTCEICQAGYQSRCVHAELMGAIGTQAERARIPLAEAPSSQPRKPRPLTSCPACWPPPMSLALAGSLPAPPRRGRARQSPSSATAPWGSSASWRPDSWAPSGSSP